MGSALCCHLPRPGLRKRHCSAQRCSGPAIPLIAPCDSSCFAHHPLVASLSHKRHAEESELTEEGSPLRQRLRFTLRKMSQQDMDSMRVQPFAVSRFSSHALCVRLYLTTCIEDPLIHYSRCPRWSHRIARNSWTP